MRSIEKKIENEKAKAVPLRWRRIGGQSHGALLGWREAFFR
jgi:hypothetical protein